MNNSLDIRAVISDSWRFMTGNLTTIIVIAFPIMFFATWLEHYLHTAFEAKEANLFGWMAQIFTYPFYGVPLILFLAQRSEGKTPAYKALFKQSLPFFTPFLLLIIIGQVLVSLGLTLLIIPGILIATSLSFAEFLLVFEKLTPWIAIQRSFKYTLPYFLMLLAIVSFLLIPLMALQSHFNSDLEFAQSVLFSDVLLHSVLSFLSIFATVITFRIFMLARQENFQQ